VQGVLTVTTPHDVARITNQIINGDYRWVLRADIENRKTDLYAVPSADDRYGYLFSVCPATTRVVIEEMRSPANELLTETIRRLAALGISFTVAKGKAFDSGQPVNRRTA
jgi:hypothetical protein